MQPFRVLFVDDEARLLSGLRRVLASLRPRWEFHFADNAEAALAALAQARFDAVVSDMLMPGMNGVEFLRRVREQHPATLRVVLSGHANEADSLAASDSAHQYLAKPCTPGAIISVIERALTPRAFLWAESLGPLISRVSHLPSLPRLYLELVEELERPNASDERIGQVVARDPALTAKLLQLVNSSFFGLPRRVVRLQQAVSLLGRSTVKSLVLLLKVNANFKPPPAALRHLERICQHSIQAGNLARRIAQLEGCPASTIETAELAAVLHDIGKLVLLDQLGEEYRRLLDQAEHEGARPSERERAIFGASHAQVGAHLLVLWGLPEEVILAVGGHDQPGRFEPSRFNELSVVHAVDALSRALESGEETDAAEWVDMAYLKAIGREGRWAVWCEAVGLRLRQGAGDVG